MKSTWVTPEKIGIIGYGIVGQALSYGFSENGLKDKYKILFYDKYKKSSSLNEVAKNSEFIFLCLPTPMKSDESGIDLSIIEEIVSGITPFTNNTEKIIIIKSTVIPETTINFEKKYPKSKFAFNPEFLTEANYLEDFVNADRTIIGASNGLVSRRIVSLYKQRFPKTRIFQTDPTSAEMVKYMANTYLALKVAFANQIYDLCQKLDIHYEEIMKMVVADKRIEEFGFYVTTERGFGQKCFPKDTVAILELAKKLGADLTILKEAWEYNKKIRKTHDWEEIPFAVSKKKKS